MKSIVSDFRNFNYSISSNICSGLYLSGKLQVSKRPCNFVVLHFTVPSLSSLHPSQNTSADQHLLPTKCKPILPYPLRRTLLSQYICFSPEMQSNTPRGSRQYTQCQPRVGIKHGTWLVAAEIKPHDCLNNHRASLTACSITRSSFSSISSHIC